jgi:hypothetical protein
MRPQPDQTKPRRIAICEDLATAPEADIVASYRESVAANANRLAEHGFRDCPRRIHDLCLVVAGVAFADRAVARKRHIWRRRLHPIIEVYDPDFWSQPATRGALSAVLSPLTGDDWIFEFGHRKQPPPQIDEVPLGIRRSDLKILPYSHGLDSYALRALEMAGSTSRSLILLTSGDSPPGFAEFQARHGKDRIEHLRLPLHTKLESKQKLGEKSYRSRAFVYGVAAGIAAFFSETRHILCAEAGQGSLGPWLDPVGTEAPDIRTHPTFHRKLEAFFQLVLDHEVRFEQPRLWDTKGQALGFVVRAGLGDSWETTFSCSDRRQFTVLAGNRVNCGACPACFLRRASLRAAQLDERKDTYLWPDLSASTFGATAHPLGRSASPNDEVQATAGIAAMQRLANRSSDDFFVSAPVHVSELAQATGLSKSEVAWGLRAVASAHGTEWGEFCESLGANSFVNSYRARLQGTPA